MGENIKKVSVKKKKSVYIFGAGFSKPAGFPIQNEILSFLDNLKLIDAPEEVIELFANSRYLAFEFIKKIYGENQKPELEDIFTILDNSINNREYFGGYTWNELDKIRDAFKRMILILFHFINDECDKKIKTFYSKIARKIIGNQSNERRTEVDSVVISLNWDCMFDFLINQNGLEKYNNKYMIDYCCDASIIDASRIGLTRNRKIHSTKILKLHGSANWLLCSSCKRLFTRLNDSIGGWHKYIAKVECPVCDKKANKTIDSKYKIPILEPFFITPTFTKVFDNIHIQMTWHYAHLVLSEADEIIFVGYSFPQADYHFRTLLKRSLNTDAKIKVILYSETKKRSEKEREVQDSYSKFFGLNNIEFYWGGVQDYFKKIR